MSIRRISIIAAAASLTVIAFALGLGMPLLAPAAFLALLIAGASAYLVTAPLIISEVR